MVTMRQLMLISETYVKWRRRLVFSKSLIFIWCLAFANSFVENSVVNIMMDFLNDIWTKENLRRAAILNNLRDGLSSIFVVYTHFLAAHTGHYSVIIFCTTSYVTGLMLLWAAIWASKFGILIYVEAMLLIALGQAGVPAIEPFLDYQLKEVVTARQSTEMNDKPPQAKTSEEEEENDHVIRFTIWWRSARLLGALIATISPAEFFWVDTIKNAALALVSSYLLFFSGYIFFAFKKPTGSPLTKICRVFKAALCKLRLEYPATLERYYWKNYKQDPKLTYSNTKSKVQLLPRFSSLWAWLDKAAIIRESHAGNHASPARQERNWNLCTIKEVREVKRFASLIFLFWTLLPYSLLVASGNTFFVEQARNLRENLKINALFLFKSILRDVVLFLIWIKNLKSFRSTKVRIGVGMCFAVLCCLAAWLVELRRLSLVEKQGHGDGEISMGTAILVPQFLLLGLMEALVDHGLEQFFDNYLPKSIWSFDGPFCELLSGIGKLLIIPFASIITSWFKESINTSHLDRYFLMLAISNFVFIVIFAYCSTKYKNDYLEDEELETEQMQEITENGQQASGEETHGILVSIAAAVVGFGATQLS